MTSGRLSLAMGMLRSREPADIPEARSSRAGRLAVWVLLALGLLLMLVSVAAAEQASASRVDRFQGPMRAGQTIRVENISGEIIASPGKEFSAVVTVTVSAATRARAEEVLEKTKIVSDKDEDGWSLETHWPGRRSNGREGRHGSSCANCRIVARYEILVPPGVTAELKTVNGDVRVRDCDGELELESVNGSIDARGARKSLQAQTVNGKIDAAADALPPSASMGLESVNGSVTLTLPKDAKFEFSASTMNGTIASTFPLPKETTESPVDEPPRKETSKDHKGERPKRVIVKTEEGDTTVVDLRELEQELSESMKDVEDQIEAGMREAEKGMREAEKGIREAEKELRRVRIADPRHDYSGSIGKGGANVRLTTLNGTVLLLAAGTREGDAKPLVSERRSFAVTIPRVEVRVARPKVEVHEAPHPPHAPAPPAPPAAPAPPAPPARHAPPAPPAPPVFDGEVVRGDIAGDFLSTSTGGNYRVGNVAGRVKILTHSGEIRVGAVGAGADLKSFGGDIDVGSVTGDLKAVTLAGDIHVNGVTGAALADTAGGDIRIERVGGTLDAKTAGGDIVAPRVGGGVRAVTAGGDVRIGMTSRDIKGGVTIRNSGGDVSLALPADCKADLELIVDGPEEDQPAIRSEFAGLAITKRPGYERATLALNGGGEKVVVRTASGTIRLKKATP